MVPEGLSARAADLISSINLIRGTRPGLQARTRRTSGRSRATGRSRGCYHAARYPWRATQEGHLLSALRLLAIAQAFLAS